MPPVALHRCFRNIEWAVIVRRGGILAIGDPMIKKPTRSRSCGIRFIVGIHNVVLQAFRRSNAMQMGRMSSVLMWAPRVLVCVRQRQQKPQKVLRVVQYVCICL